MAGWLRSARRMVRIARIVGFALRASDRLMRQMAPLFNRNLLLFERADVAVTEPEYLSALTGLRERFYYRAAEMVDWLPSESRAGRAVDMSAHLTSSGSRLGSTESSSATVPDTMAAACDVPDIVNNSLYGVLKWG